MRLRPLLVVTALAAVLTGCSDEPEPVVVRAEEPAVAAPAYDDTLEPAAAVMAVVPGDATVLEVTDYDQVRYQLGFGDLSSASPAAVRRDFWARAEAEAPLLSTGMLRETGYEFTQDDVAYEAHFSGPAGEGYVVKFHDGLDMRGVQEAAKAADGPLAGAVVVPSVHLAALGATREPTESWAADPALLELVGRPAGSTYVSRDCVPAADAFGPEVDPDLAGLDALGAFSVAYGGELATVRLGSGRPDAFERARLTDADLGDALVKPVADPSGGRIGFEIGDGPVAAERTLQRRLPFAVCAG